MLTSEQAEELIQATREAFEDLDDDQLIQVAGGVGGCDYHGVCAGDSGYDYHGTP